MTKEKKNTITIATTKISEKFFSRNIECKKITSSLGTHNNLNEVQQYLRASCGSDGKEDGEDPNAAK